MAEETPENIAEEVEAAAAPEEEAPATEETPATEEAAPAEAPDEEGE